MKLSKDGKQRSEVKRHIGQTDSIIYIHIYIMFIYISAGEKKEEKTIL